MSFISWSSYYIALFLFFYNCTFGFSQSKHTLLYLLPLSGVYYGEGVSARVGAEIALDAEGFVNSTKVLPDGTIIEVIFENTECDWTIEHNIIAKYLRIGKEKLYILGGGCFSYQRKFKLPVLLDIVPQIVFFSMPIPFMELTQTFNLLPFQPTGLIPLVEIIHKRNVSSLIILHDNELSFTQNYNAVLLEIRQKNIEVEAAINLFDDKGKAKYLSDVVNAIEEYRSRVILLLADYGNLIKVFCAHFSISNRFHIVSAIPKRLLLDIKNISCFSNRTFTTSLYEYTPVSNLLNTTFLVENRLRIGGNSQLTVSLAYDATSIMVMAIEASNGSQSKLVDYIRTSSWNLASGKIVFNEFYQDRNISFTAISDDFGPSSNEISVSHQRIRAHVAIVGLISFVTIVMICYAILIISFNISYHSQTIIRLTSVPLNVIAASSSLFLGIALLLNGVGDLVDNVGLSQILKSVAFCLFPLSFNVILATHWLRAFRVHKIFSMPIRNKVFLKDWTFFIWILLLVFLDVLLAVLIVSFDPIKCRLHVWKTTPISESHSVVYQYNFCSNSFWYLWIGILYLLKTPTFTLSIVFTWKTREITLPALKDFKTSMIALFVMLGLSIVATPVLLEPIHPTISYGVSSISYLSMICIYFSCQFAPKMLMYWNAKKHGDEQLMTGKTNFHESFRGKSKARSLQTQSEYLQTSNRLFSCCSCINNADTDNEAQDSMKCLHQEIDNLKKNLQERDRTIRGLNDMVFFGGRSKLAESRNANITEHSDNDAQFPAQSRRKKQNSLSQTSRSPPSGNSGDSVPSPAGVYQTNSNMSESLKSDELRRINDAIQCLPSYNLPSSQKVYAVPHRPPRRYKPSTASSSANSDPGGATNLSNSSSLRTSYDAEELRKLKDDAGFTMSANRHTIYEDPTDVRIGYSASENLEDLKLDEEYMYEVDDFGYLPSILSDDHDEKSPIDHASDASSDFEDWDLQGNQSRLNVHVDMHQPQSGSDVLLHTLGNSTLLKAESAYKTNNFLYGKSSSNAITSSDLQPRDYFSKIQSAFIPSLEPSAETLTTQRNIVHRQKSSADAERYPSRFTMNV